MTDITEKLRKYAINQHGWIDIDDTCEAAADEIERLRKEVRQLRVEAGYDHIASADCWCKPTELENGIFVHNSSNRREEREEGGLQ